MPDLSNAAADYHRWYYDSQVWMSMTYRGVPIQKWLGDLWNYQEIICWLEPQLVVEFGSLCGGSALYFADLLSRVRPGSVVLAVDVSLNRLHERARQHAGIQWMQADSASPLVAERIRSLRGERPGPAFFIVDSDHSKGHVLAELENLRDVTEPGDYVIVEDGNINGHPVLPGWGEGPYEALTEYFLLHPDDYREDTEREMKFGFTFAPRGFLVRQVAG